MDDSADGGGIHSTSEAEDARPSEGVQRSEGEGLQTSEDEGEALHPPEHGHGEAVLPVVRQLRMHPALVLRYVGDTHMKSVASLCLEGDMRPYHAPHLEKKHRLAWKNTFETCFGELPRAALPLKAEAKSLGTTTQRLRERMCGGYDNSLLGAIVLVLNVQLDSRREEEGDCRAHCLHPAENARRNTSEIASSPL